MMWPFKCKLSACTYTRCCLFFKFEKMKLWHLVEICFWLNLAVKRSNEVCLHINYLFLKELAIVSDVFLLALLSLKNLHSLPEVVWRVFSRESTPLVIQQSLLPKQFIHLCLFLKFAYLFYFIANIFFSKSIAWNLILSRIPYSVSVFGFRVPCFSAAVIFIHHVWGETVLFIIQTPDRIRYFTTLQDKLHSVNIQEDQLRALRETVEQISKIIHTASLNFSRLLWVVFSSQQRLNPPAVNAVQWRHSLPENRVVIFDWWIV